MLVVYSITKRTLIQMQGNMLTKSLEAVSHPKVFPK